MIAELQQFHKDLKSLRADIGKETAASISKVSLRSRAEKLASSWFSDIASALAKYQSLSSETIERYSEGFARLLKLSNPNNLKSSYLEVLTFLSKKFQDELILPLKMQPKLAEEVSLLTKLFKDLASPEEDAYMKEAIACATHELYRGSAVLGWSAGVDRIHRVIEKIGFAKFNSTSQAMAAATTGRFKRFNSATNISSISELREVFDSNLLWILEGMLLLDSNQHTRLRSCFDLRCQCSHPGDAPITEFNLLSFFSDIDEIVFKNPKFAV